MWNLVKLILAVAGILAVELAFIVHKLTKLHDLLQRRLPNPESVDPVDEIPVVSIPRLGCPERTRA
jgi:hypothetical protein